MRRVLFDSDVLLDVLAQRQPFVVASAQALNTVTQEDVEGYVSGHAITNIFYILRRQVGSEVALRLLSTLLERIEVASITDQVIRAALQSSMTDFEDAVSSEAALALGLDLIVTRNISDFVSSSVPVMLPEEFLAARSEST
ncbi:MAG: PIN domain-containing protein [Moorea sp. SIO1F2]|uniref:PIN domain-containing protein n=1 Tax=unclassified Moorena TaxID=2683338 RepID=UPI0013BE4B71|nr:MULTISPECIES: PIN domain-containing protein [unclassified Moorena]NEN98770.1 PIN domain-containing protein [Moorena sp. SIO3I7]NEP25989.1 PIN domain-containing protein [Moorena sp. SIO3I6]NEO05103.1 PIN domain-containing protein [Moorena sp. SIO3I8]NEO18961.1 PIN domain-containing protein [Moorena sp. SIO4A5]NEQ56163.1 PIN domain-containing protein [Moorena sp. SIO4A1]